MRRRHRAALTLVGLLMGACQGAATSDRSAGDATAVRVVTTVAPITNIVSNVAGGHATIAGVVPEGTNSHTFEPPPSVARVLSEADVIFVNGMQLEDPTRELAEANLKRGAGIVELGALTLAPSDYIYDFSFPKEGGKPNPHLWTNPPMAKRYAEIVKDELSERDPANADAFRENYERFAAKVEVLAGAMRSATATVPETNRKLLTYHDGYAYFARDFGWKVIGAIQPSSFDEPTPREVAELIRQVEQENVPAIFGSEVFPSPVLEQIGREAGVKYVDVLRDDDLPGEPEDPDHTWLGLMRFDYVTMVEALGGDAAALEAVDVSNVVRDTAEYPQ
ncbi:MAG: metal ABC transporter substrate-binding protein [Actinomycetota bacterium]